MSNYIQQYLKDSEKNHSVKKDTLRGFTVIEFLLSLAFFSFFIIFITLGFTQINRSYSRGISVKEAQQAARFVLEDMSRSIQASSTDLNIQTPTSGGLYRFCVGGVKYAWNEANSSGGTEERLKDSLGNPIGEPFSMIKAPIGGGCEEQISESSYTPIIEGNLIIQDLKITQAVPGSSTVYKIDLVLSTDDEALQNSGDGDNVSCNFSDRAAKQYCQIIKMSTAVSLRQ